MPSEEEFCKIAKQELSYTATAFSLTGTVFGGAAGFVTGYAGGYLYSKNNDFALKNGAFFSGIGAAVGSAIGLIYGLSTDGEKYLKDKPQIYTSPIMDNHGNQNGECVLRCLEEFSESYGQSQYDFNYWYSQNGNKLGVHANDVKSLINNTNIFSSDKLAINPFSGDFSDIATAMSQGKRVMMGFKSPNGEHAVMVDKLILWGNNKYRIFFSETSPIRIAPRSTSNLIKSIGAGAGFWTFFF